MLLAHSLFFGSSLENMYKELGSTIEGFKHPGHGNLIGWAEQGLSIFIAMFAHQHALPQSAPRRW